MIINNRMYVIHNDLPGNNLSGVPVQFATQFGANATQ